MASFIASIGTFLSSFLFSFLSLPPVRYTGSLLSRNRLFFLVPIVATTIHLLRTGHFGRPPVAADFNDHDGSGLEDENLWTIYGFGDPLSANRAKVSAFLAGFVVDPRTAL